MLTLLPLTVLFSPFISLFFTLLSKLFQVMLAFKLRCLVVQGKMTRYWWSVEIELARGGAAQLLLHELGRHQTKGKGYGFSLSQSVPLIYPYFPAHLHHGLTNFISSNVNYTSKFRLLQRKRIQFVFGNKLWLFMWCLSPTTDDFLQLPMIFSYIRYSVHII